MASVQFTVGLPCNGRGWPRVELQNNYCACHSGPAPTEPSLAGTA
jgi:hypothetical protein